MLQSEMICSLIEKNTEMLKKHLSDFSDADLMARPVPGANHAAWQLAHLAHFEAMVAGILSPGASVPTPPNFQQSQGKEAAKSDDPSHFPTKDEVFKVLDSARDVQLAALRKMSDADLDKPSPEKFQGFAKTLGLLALMIPMHTTMHVGQFQVIRRKLGKPVLF